MYVVLDGIYNTHLTSNTFHFLKSCRLCGHYEKHVAARRAIDHQTEYNVKNMGFALLIIKTTMHRVIMFTAAFDLFRL
jgi:hypothetical protein